MEKISILIFFNKDRLHVKLEKDTQSGDLNKNYGHAENHA